MADIFVVALLLLACLPLSATLSKGPSAYLLSPALSALFALIAGLSHVLVDLPILVIWSALASLQILLLLYKTSRNRILESLQLRNQTFRPSPHS